jgi:hypothetical protein
VNVGLEDEAERLTDAMEHAIFVLRGGDTPIYNKQSDNKYRPLFVSDVSLQELIEAIAASDSGVSLTTAVAKVDLSPPNVIPQMIQAGIATPSIAIVPPSASSPANGYVVPAEVVEKQIVFKVIQGAPPGELMSVLFL